MAGKTDTSAPIPPARPDSPAQDAPSTPKRVRSKVSQDALARHLCLDRGARSVRELFDKGVLPGDVDRQAMTTADMDRCREAYILHLRAAAAGRQEKENDDPVDDSRDEKVQLALLRAETRKIVIMKRRKLAGELVDRGSVRLAVSTAFMRVRTVLLKIPKKHAASLAKITDPVKAREYLDERINEALSELASTPVENIGREAEADEIDLDDVDLEEV